ncbi:hypothetical protein ACFWUP_20770 [Nocardia sp. NPDC058658]|uniref:hypothetical protein n=1 Tax=Nocardia sp. NPDC058658 TaxID=3346580 RepID=UPI0036611B3B
MKRLRAYKIFLAEPVDQTGLNNLRAVLGLHPRGRLNDDWNYEFGYKYLKDTGVQAVKLVLWRADDAPWHLTVSYSNDNIPTAEELNRWQAEIIAGVESTGFSATIRDSPEQ